ncbi:unnamed protein product [marine sediment metagenome]|uniref:Uncharacterized protein n=1 Tax=marine sediment metagenome TaxID=412755 RepID=X0V7V7_9ZZZZ
MAMRLRSFQIATLAAYAVALSVWSGNIMLGGGGHWLAGAVPVVGWLRTLAKLDLWSSGFTLMAALWVACVAAIVVLRRL